MTKSAEELKQLSIKEFTEAAKVYESGHAGIYEMCKDDYPQMLEELELEPFEDALDVGCGTGAVLELLHARYPNKHLTGLDLTPGMIDVARAKQLDNVSFVVGDAEALPFEPRSFDAVLCSNSFHHYPHPERFFAEVARILRPGGRLVLRDYTSNGVAVWLMTTLSYRWPASWAMATCASSSCPSYARSSRNPGSPCSSSRRRRASAHTWWHERNSEPNHSAPPQT